CEQACDAEFSARVFPNYRLRNAVLALRTLVPDAGNEHHFFSIDAPLTGIFDVMRGYEIQATQTLHPFSDDTPLVLSTRGKRSGDEMLSTGSQWSSGDDDIDLWGRPGDYRPEVYIGAPDVVLPRETLDATQHERAWAGLSLNGRDINATKRCAGIVVGHLSGDSACPNLSIEIKNGYAARQNAGGGPVTPEKVQGLRIKSWIISIG